MKTIKLSIIMLSLVFFTNCFAQKESKKDKKDKKAVPEEVTTPTPAPVVENQAPVVTEECLNNISLFNESAKNKQYADAIVPWYAAYKDCPGAQRAIYMRGRDILVWKLSQTKDEASYKAVFEELMMLFDNRVKYFGNDDRYPTAWIIGNKALDYITFVKGDVLKKTAYKWLGESVDGMGNNTELAVMQQLLFISNAIYKAEPAHAEKFISDYIKVNNILEYQLLNVDPSKLALTKQMKEGLDALFVQSGAANCTTMDGLYKSKVAENIANLEYLNKVIDFYKRIRCDESEIYFTASVAAHKMQPTTETADGCAAMSYKKGEFSKAISYYDEAANLSTDKLEKAEFLYKIAQIYYAELNSVTRARDYARKSLEFNPNNGSPYLLIGIMYAKSRNIYDDPVLAKTVYWVAVDKFVKAKQVDSSPKNIEDADKLIRSYSGFFPSKDDIFFQPDLQAGKSFFVGGWIGESTICR